MWNISVRVLLLFVPVLYANVSSNDCHSKAKGYTAIHACQDSSFSDTAVAMDASMFSGSYCECNLTLTTSRDCVVFVDVVYDYISHIIQFFVDNITYTNNSRDKLHYFNSDSIRIVVEQTYTGDRELLTGNPCMIFRGRGPKHSSCKITLSCSNGTDIDPRQSDFTTQSNKLQENVPTQSADFTTKSNKMKENVPTKSGGTYTVIIIIVVVTVVCTAIIMVLITCYCKRRKSSPIKSDENTIKPRNNEVKENTMNVPMELLNESNYTQGSTEHVYDQPDIDIIAIRAHEKETKPLLQGQGASIYENEVKGMVEQSAGDEKDITVVANSEKHTRESQDHIPNEQKEQLYTQLDKSKSNNTTSASTEHIYNVLG